MEMHLFDENAREEEALCGVETLDEERRSVGFYLEDRCMAHPSGTSARSARRWRRR